jgi:hypothetical protein
MWNGRRMGCSGTSSTRVSAKISWLPRCAEADLMQSRLYRGKVRPPSSENATSHAGPKGGNRGDPTIPMDGYTYVRSVEQSPRG